MKKFKENSLIKILDPRRRLKTAFYKKILISIVDDFKENVAK